MRQRLEDDAVVLGRLILLPGDATHVIDQVRQSVGQRNAHAIVVGVVGDFERRIHRQDDHVGRVDRCGRAQARVT
jgi:hypothetical protein